MVYGRVPIPSLPCPYCLEVHNNDPETARWLGPNGGDVESVKTEIELHMAECDRRNDPIATGFVEASELVGRTNSGFGLTDESEHTDNQTTGALKPNTGDN